MVGKMKVLDLEVYHGKTVARQMFCCRPHAYLELICSKDWWIAIEVSPDFVSPVMYLRIRKLGPARQFRFVIQLTTLQCSHA